MGLSEALATLWPVLTTLGSGYLGLLWYIRKIMEERLDDKNKQILELRAERDQFRDLALRSVNVAEQVVRKTAGPTGG